MLLPGGPWIAAGLLGLTNCLAFCDRMLVALLAPAIKASLALSDLMIGLLAGTAFVLPYVIGTVALASVGRRAVRLRIVRLSLIVWTAATVDCGFAHSAAALLAARMVLGLGQAPLTPAAATYLAAALPSDRIGRATSVFTMGATLGRSAALLGGGAALAWIGAPLLGDAEGWRAVFVLAVVPGVLLLILLSFLKEPAEMRPPYRSRSSRSGAGCGRIGVPMPVTPSQRPQPYWSSRP